MATTEILLTKPIDGLGGEGDLVKVRAGYARNFLLPRNMALPVNRANQKQVEALKKARAEREMKELDASQVIAKSLESASIAIAVKTGEGGKMFGSVTAANLVDRLAEDGIKIHKKKIQMAAPIKELGKHTVQVKLHAQVSVDFEFEIVSENIIE